MTENIIKCAARRHKQKIINNEIIDKDESGIDKIEHEPLVLGLIWTTVANDGRPKGSTLKN